MTFLSKIIGLIRDMKIASVYGASEITDAYNIALTVPNILYMVCASAIMITFIPNFYEVEEEEGKKGAFRFANKIITILLLISIVFYLISMLNAKALVEIIAPNLSKESFELTIKLTRITLINLIFTVIASVFSSILRCNNKYLGISLMPIFMNVPIIIFLFLNLWSNDIVLTTIVTTIGSMLQFIILIPELKGLKFKFRIQFKGYNDRVIDIFMKVLPILFGLAVSQISLIVDKNIGSSFTQGTITSLEMSNKITSVIYGVLTSTVVTVFLPVMAKQFLNEDKNEWLETIKNIIIYMFIFTIPITIGAYILNKEIISLMYERGAFTQQNTNLVSAAFVGYLLQVPFLCIRDIIGQAFYSSKNTIIPTINGLVTVIINIVLTVILSKIYGVFGITLATSISIILSSILFLITLKKVYPILNIKDLIIKSLKITLSSIIMGVGVYILYNQLFFITSNLIILVICTFIGILIYFLTCKLLRVNEINNVYKLMKDRVQKK